MPCTFVSRLKASVHDGIRRSTVIQEGAMQDSIEILIGKGKIRLGSYRLFHSVREFSVTGVRALLRPSTFLLDARLGSSLVNRSKNVYVFGTLSHTLSVPSVSGPLLVCGYHIGHDLSESDTCEDRSMGCSVPAQSGTIGECLSQIVNSSGGLDAVSLHNHGISYGFSNPWSCKMTSMCLKRPEQPSNSSVYGFFVLNTARRWFNFSPYLWPRNRDFHSSCLACFPVGPAHDVTPSNSAGEGQTDGSSVSSVNETSAGKCLKLLSGSCYLPHPDKEDTGGEDAHFIWDELAIGVADGVGGWADVGVDAGQYSRELMSNSVPAIQEEPKESIDPARVLEKAHACTKVKGSSTACIIALTDKSLHAINLGDSGFMVVRDGCTIFRSPVQQHGFNFTYQLESGKDGDLPSSGQVFTVPVAPGDVIIAGTDGLFDNLYNNEITAVVVHAVRAGLGPQVTAQKIAALARQRAQEKDRQTPFSAAAQEAGIRYHGGKLDDITVVVSYITSSKNL